MKGFLKPQILSVLCEFLESKAIPRYGGSWKVVVERAKKTVDEPGSVEHVVGEFCGGGESKWKSWGVY